MSPIRPGIHPDPTDRSRSVPPSRTAVIVTCYNQERFIRQSLDSIAAQTRAASEVVVIDGCSQDRSVRVIERWIAENDMPITFIAHDRNYGLCATLNQGMSEISSDFVLTLYGDDWLEPTRIERQAPVLEGAPEDLFTATFDKLHQGYRADVLGPATLMVRALRERGLAAVVSGAGPSVLVLGTGLAEAGLESGSPEWLQGIGGDSWRVVHTVERVPGATGMRLAS